MFVDYYYESVSRVSSAVQSQQLVVSTVLYSPRIDDIGVAVISFSRKLIIKSIDKHAISNSSQSITQVRETSTWNQDTPKKLQFNKLDCNINFLTSSKLIYLLLSRSRYLHRSSLYH